MDWLRVLEIFIGAFLGFILGIASTVIWKLIGIRKLKNNIRIELRTIYNNLVKPNGKLQRSRIDYQTDVWAAAISSAMVLDITRNLDYYLSIKEIYKLINELGEMEKNESNFSNESKFNEIIEKRKSLEKTIDESNYLS